MLWEVVDGLGIWRVLKIGIIIDFIFSISWSLELVVLFIVVVIMFGSVVIFCLFVIC